MFVGMIRFPARVAEAAPMKTRLYHHPVFPILPFLALALILIAWVAMT